uniref:Ankyrin repeat containing protein n=1 Tax=Megaviridae environmental sample TaxID=1737588 RepID=A0A5J6VJH7_9VIRU|nr:MAG: ankyrin repeat containing protein [Megaviridae environmental sample]
MLKSELFNLIKNNKYNQFFDFVKENPKFDYDIYDTNNNYLIHFLIIYNKIEIIDFLLKNSKIRIDITDNDGHSLIYFPIKYNYIKLLEILLEHDKYIIGISIIDIQDNFGYTSIHYACLYNNINAFKILYNYNANIYITDNINNYNIFETVIHYKRYDMLLYLLEKNNKIIFKNINGETLLQILLANEMFVIIEKIFDKKFNVNNQEYKYGLTALHQAIILNQFNIAKMIINNGGDINLQDYLGNNSIHYAIIEKNFKYLEYINKFKVNYELTNLNGNTYLHLLLSTDYNITENDKFNSFKILLNFIKNTDLNIQNNDGITCLHIMAEKNYLSNDNVKNILKNNNKVLNLFIKDNINDSVLDKLNDTDDLLNLTTDIYYNILIEEKNKDIFVKKWEYYCSTNNLKLIMKELNKRTGSSSDICKNKIRDILKKKKRSIPKYKNIKITIDSGIYMNDLFYTGSIIDILFGLIWLRQNYSNLNLILNYPITINKNLNKHYDSIGQNVINDFNNIEIMWSYHKLILPDNFRNVFKTKNTNDFCVIPIGIEINSKSHANIILVDNINKTIERFEPNGKNYPRNLYYNSKLLDNLLNTLFDSLLDDYKYYTPKDYEPIIGLQILETLEDSKFKKIGDPNGFCAIWCIWWIHQKLYNKDIESKKLIELLIKEIKFKNQSFKNLIRNFSQNIVTLRDTYLKKYNLDINEWILENYTNKQFLELEQDILNII